MKEINFEFYAVNENINGREIEMWNIFQNCVVNRETNKLCIEYKKKKMTFDEFVERLDRIIKCEEWARCEYEVVVTDWPSSGKVEKKIDCWWQAHANIRVIAKYVLEEYYPRLKIKLNEESTE